MKIGVYISGLGRSFVNENIEKYAARLMHEMSFDTTGIEYEIKKENITYKGDQDSTVISICKKSKGNEVIYKIYDFSYHDILTEKFNNYPLILKNMWLFLLVFKKFPLIIKRLFYPANYNRPFQSFYLFLIFLIIACSVLLMLPATLGVVTEFFEDPEYSNVILNLKDAIGVKQIPFISKEGIATFSKVIVSFTAFLLLIVPNANALITNLATEFVCANDYFQYGAQRQLLQGNLEHLVDYITEHEIDRKIHFHTYSFGSVLALDYIFPFGNKVTRNTELFCEAIITIGTPFEFINSYYPKFYKNRKTEIGNKIQWLNVYSISDALGTNFRNDAKVGDAQFGIDQKHKPININYEVAPMNKGSILDFILLYSVRVHGMYWDNKAEGQSCLRLIYEAMNKRNLI